MDVVEMQVMTTEGSNGATHLSSERAPIVSGGDVMVNFSEALEVDELLWADTGEKTPQNHCPSQQIPTSQQESTLCWIKRELNEVAFWKVRVWMIFICIFVIIIAVILISLAVCAALHEDEDEKFDPSLFTVPLYHNGSFTLPNQPFTEDLANMYSNKSQVLAADLEEKIAGLYTSSPALGRYFSEASIDAFSGNGSVVADYGLKFLMPEAEGEELRRFTLSREMVLNVFRQFLYDQEEDRAQPLFIAPDSLQML